MKKRIVPLVVGMFLLLTGCSLSVPVVIVQDGNFYYEAGMEEEADKDNKIEALEEAGLETPAEEKPERQETKDVSEETEETPEEVKEETEKKQETAEKKEETKTENPVAENKYLLFTGAEGFTQKTIYTADKRWSYNKTTYTVPATEAFMPGATLNFYWEGTAKMGEYCWEKNSYLIMSSEEEHDFLYALPCGTANDQPLKFMDRNIFMQTKAYHPLAGGYYETIDHGGIYKVIYEEERGFACFIDDYASNRRSYFSVISAGEPYDRNLYYSIIKSIMYCEQIVKQ